MSFWDEVFENAVRLQCNLHLTENLLGRKSVSSPEAHILFGIVDVRMFCIFLHIFFYYRAREYGMDYSNRRHEKPFENT